MDAKLNKPLQALHDRVKAIGDVRSAITELCEGFYNQLLKAKDTPEQVESLALQLGVNSAEWANACLQNTPAVARTMAGTPAA
jgi:hypothetical protein